MWVGQGASNEPVVVAVVVVGDSVGEKVGAVDGELLGAIVGVALGDNVGDLHILTVAMVVRKKVGRFNSLSCGGGDSYEVAAAKVNKTMERSA